jgi:hypothetical protein
MILRHLELPATTNDFATCHMTLFGWRNRGRVRTLRLKTLLSLSDTGSSESTTFVRLGSGS